MKKVVPFIFPLVALIIVLGLLFRWYNLRTSSQGEISPAADSIEVNEVSDETAQRLNRPAADMPSVPMQSTATNSAQPRSGTVRYETVDGQVNFSVSANLPESQTGFYQVWLRSQGKVSKAMRLVMGKGGWMANGSVNQDHLPLEIIVTHEETDDNTMEQEYLKAQITKAQ